MRSKQDGCQCTICWYVDDTKISHINKHIVDEVINSIESHLGKMTVTRGKAHTFVGIDILFNEDGTVCLLVDDYIKECANVYADEVKRKAATLAKGNLFDEDEGNEAGLISEQKADKFHHTGAKL